MSITYFSGLTMENRSQNRNFRPRRGPARGSYGRSGGGQSSGSTGGQQRRPYGRSTSARSGGRPGGRDNKAGGQGRSRFGGSRGPQRFRGAGGRGGRGFSAGPKIDENRYIKKAVAEEAKAPFVPGFTFEELNIDPRLKKNLSEKGFKSPTPIQDQAMKLVLEGKDVLGVANTGTGKTLVFLVPLIQKVIRNRNEKVLIMVPTRELAEQINGELYSITNGLQVFSTECTGGNSIGKQIMGIRRGSQFIIGTPGRLKDLRKRGVLDLRHFTNIVLDEVDRMLDMGFINDIKEVVSELPENRQSLFFSATVDHKVEELIHMILKKDYSKVVVSTGQTPQNVEQNVVRYGTLSEKLMELEKVLRSDNTRKSLVFVSTKRGVDRLEKELQGKGLYVTSIHGEKRQRDRRRAIEAFKEGKVDVLVATDVAARGLDISGITHVINYDEPRTFDDYVHRIGRTGRADKSGTALTFVNRG